jgi:hypothetical protein
MRKRYSTTPLLVFDNISHSTSGPRGGTRSLDRGVPSELQLEPCVVSQARDALLLRPPRLPRCWPPPGRPTTRRVSFLDQGSVRGVPRDRLLASAVSGERNSQTLSRV